MTVLRDLLEASLDGEWGQGESTDDTVEMSVIRGTDFGAVRVGQMGDVPVRFLHLRHARRKTLQANDIVFETAGGSKDRPTGRSLFLTPSRLSCFERPVSCASFARFLRIDPRKAEPAYVFWLLQDLYKRHELLRFHTQHTGVARFQFTTFADNYELQLPDPDIQRRIADILSTYDDLIEVNTRRIAILEEMARRLFDEWFVKFRFPGASDGDLTESAIGRVPRGWDVVSIKDVCSDIDYGFTAKAVAEDVGPKFLRITDIVPTSIDWSRVPYCAIDEKKLRQYELRDGDIVVARTGATTGYAKRLNKAHPKTIFASYLVRFRVDPAHSNIFVGTMVQSEQYKRFIKSNIGGSAQPNANAQILASMKFASPPRSLLGEFDRHVAPIVDLQEIFQIQNANLGAARDLLLPKLISGEINVSPAGRIDKQVAAE